MPAEQPLVQVALKAAGSGHGRYAVVTIRQEPVNALNWRLWSALTRTLDDLEASGKSTAAAAGSSQSASPVRGLILQSGLTRDLFTAGNDLKELYAPGTTPEQFKRFWLAQTTFLARLYRSPLVTMTAIRY